MDIYQKRRRGKILFLSIAILIGVASLVYTNWLTKKMAQEEQKKVELWAEAIERQLDVGFTPRNDEGEVITESGALDPNVVSSGEEEIRSNYLGFLEAIYAQNTTIPMIIVDSSGDFNLDSNIKYSKDNREQALSRELKKMKEYANPIQIDIWDGNYNLLYYNESDILRNLRIYPFIQLFVIVVFIVVAYFAFAATQRAEQNQVWVGMSKETAHQLGTPISSLMAWIEILKLQKVDDKLISEFEKDTQRLEKITERFSKIGSKPELLQTNLIDVLYSTVTYLRTRSSSKIKFETGFSASEMVVVPLNAALFSWVIENLCKNAIDAIDNHGVISIMLKEKDDQVFIDVTDTGKGVHKSQFKTIFQPGFSTKKRGWGLGLSLAKRIIENYHSGKIFIKSSELGKGTTFRIILNK